jgi:hypothetical protein
LIRAAVQEVGFRRGGKEADQSSDGRRRSRGHAETLLPKLEKVVPDTKVARYIKIENKICAVVNYALAAQIPPELMI